MDIALLAEYGWVLIVLVLMEGLLAADNALVLAIMVRHLPKEKRRKALFYGLAGAFVLRFVSLFLISFLVNIWQVQAIGAVYLLFLSFNHVFRKLVKGKAEEEGQVMEKKPKKQSGFWMTVFKVELADVAFALDSILAAVALAMTLPNTPLPAIGGMDGGKFLVIFAGGMIGVIIMRFAAGIFIRILEKRPGLEMAAFVIVGWVGIKLAVLTLSHPSLSFISESFAHSTAWKVTFYVVLIAIAAAGWFFSKNKNEKTSEKTSQVS